MEKMNIKPQEDVTRFLVERYQAENIDIKQDAGKAIERILLDIIDGKIKVYEGRYVMDILKAAGGRASSTFDKKHRVTFWEPLVTGKLDNNFLLDEYATQAPQKSKDEL